MGIVRSLPRNREFAWLSLRKRTFVWLLYFAIPVVVLAMLAFMFWRMAFRMRRDRILGRRSAVSSRPAGTADAPASDSAARDAPSARRGSAERPTAADESFS